MMTEPTEITGWVVHFDGEGFSVAPRSPRQAHDYGDPRTYPIALALPVVFASQGEAGRCVEWLERLVGRLVLSGTARPAPNSVESILQQTRESIARDLNRRGPTSQAGGGYVGMEPGEGTRI